VEPSSSFRKMRQIGLYARREAITLRADSRR
jgi:hypothetical protein